MRWLARAAVLFIALLTTGCLTPLTGEPPPHILTPVPTPSSPLVGVFAPGGTDAWSGVSDFASATGINPRIVACYTDWNDGFCADFAETAWRHDAYVLAQMQPTGVRLASIAAGRSDNYLRSYADAIRSFGHPVMVSFGHEMNGTWYSWGAGHETPATFVAAWRHIVQVFRAEGAKNITWVWSVNSTNVGANTLRQWWPGAAWVTWVGIDGYYYWSRDTFDSVFGTTIAQIRTFSNAPVLIAETAVGVTANRESQITALFAGVREAGLVGVVWFNEAQHSGIYHQNWRLQDDPSALAAFTAAVRTYLS